MKALGCFAVLVSAVVLGPLMAVSPGAAFAAAVVLIIGIAAFIHPPAAAYVLVAATPLIAGFNRGTAIPVLRPSEGLAFLVGGALFARKLLTTSGTLTFRSRLKTPDASILFLVLTGSFVPLAWGFLRGVGLTQDDILYSFQIVKYFVIYLIIRASVQTETEVRRCLILSVGAGVIVAIIAVLQSIQAFGVPGLLAEHYAPNGHTDLLEMNRGSSTLGHAFAVADLVIFNLAIVGAWLRRKALPAAVLVTVALLFLVATLASGQFSGALALLVGLLTLGICTGQFGRAVVGLLVTLVVAGVLLQPVIDRRLSGFSSGQVPASWTARLDNLRTWVWPELGSDFNYVLGVRPSARIPIHEGTPEEDVVYIESGYTWFLWVGGIPLLLAFLGFLMVNLRHTWRRARHRSDAIGVAGTASFVALATVTVVTLFDPHLTLRGSADLLFSLLALAYVHVSTPEEGTAASPAVDPAPRTARSLAVLDTR